MTRHLGGSASRWLLFSCLAIGLLSPCSLAVELFGPRVALNTGDVPTYAVSADFDGNGVVDFAVANSFVGSVTVVLSDGLGGFEVLPPIDVGIPAISDGFAASIAAGDFDLDGAADLAVADLLGGSLVVLHGDGEGNFSLGTPLDLDGGPIFLVAGDFNFDGAADLAVALSFVDSVSVLLSDRQGGFSVLPEIHLGAGRHPHSITLGDLDGDGTEDLAVANLFGDSVSILIGDGDGGFEVTQEIAVGDGSSPGSIASGDFDSDGLLDLAVALSAFDSVAVLGGDGAGAFALTTEVPEVGDSPVWLDEGDFDGDGSSDLVVANLVGRTVALLRGGDDGLVNAGQVEVGSEGGASDPTVPEVEGQDSPRAVMAGEFTNDGLLDVLVVHAGTDVVSILPGDGLGGFGRPTQIGDLELDLAPYLEQWIPSCVKAADFNGDDRIDLAVTSAQSDWVNVFLGDGQGGFDQNGIETAIASPSCMAIDDFDGDGDLDLAMGQQFDQDSVQFMFGDGDGGFSPATSVSLGEAIAWVDSGDLDGDGHYDFLAVPLYGERLKILLGDGNGGVRGEIKEVPFDLGSFSTAALEDLDEDGALDLIAVLYDLDKVAVLPGDGTADFSVPDYTGPVLRVTAPPEIAGEIEFLPAQFGPLPTLEGARGEIRLADDGVEEFTDDLGRFWPGGTTTDACQPLIDDAEGAIVMVLRGSCLFTTKVKHAQDAGAIAVLVVNLSNSNIRMAGSDPTITIPSVMIGIDDGLRIFSRLPGVQAIYNDPDLETTTKTGTRPGDLGIGDFNGDGLRDLAVTNTRGGSVSILMGGANRRFGPVYEIPVGAEPRSVAVADFNLDDLDDVAIALRGGSAVTVLISGGDGSFSRTPSFHTGSGCTSVAAADFDGDGDPDLAAVNYRANSVSLLYNRIEDRADPNGSNRVDAFDVAEVGRRFGLHSGEPGYTRNSDIDLNGVIDGDDLFLVTSRFGELIQQASPLAPLLEDPPTPQPNTITLQQVAAEGSVLTVGLRVNENSTMSTAAEFSVAFDPGPDDPEATPVLEAIGFDPGDYFAGGLTQAYQVESRRPGKVDVRVARLPGEDRVGPGQRLIDLKLRALRSGSALIEFEAIEGRAQPVLLDATGNEIAGVSFVGGGNVTVDATNRAAVGQKIGFSPARLDFGDVPAGISSKKRLRLSNFGFSDLEVHSIASSLPDFVSFFTTSFTVPPFGSVDLPVEFSPVVDGVRAGELIVGSNDPNQPEIRVPVVGRSAVELAVSPTHLSFGTIPVGEATTRKIGVSNRGDSPLVLTSFAVSDSRFNVAVDFTVIDPGEVGRIEVEFQPTSTDDLHALLTLGFDGPAGTSVSLSLSGSGREEP